MKLELSLMPKQKDLQINRELMIQEYEFNHKLDRKYKYLNFFYRKYYPSRYLPTFRNDLPEYNIN